MGGSNTKGLWLCEQIYPPENGRSAIPPEKLQKAIEKGLIPPQNTVDEEDVDQDEDAKIDAAIREVWGYYDKKGEGFISRKTAEQFFKDALQIFALRKNCKPKDLLGPGISMGSALSQSYKRLDKTGQGRIDFAAFEEFVNECDLDEAMAIITGNTGPIEVNTSTVQMVDTDQIARDKAAAGANIQYRDYGEVGY